MKRVYLPPMTTSKRRNRAEVYRVKERPQSPAQGQGAEVRRLGLELTCLSVPGSHVGCRGEVGGVRESRQAKEGLAMDQAKSGFCV